MKQIIPFKKELPFKTKVSEITSISLEREIRVEDSIITGVFHITGDYKMNEGSINRENFNFDLPFDITLDPRYDIKTVTSDIEDFYYDVQNEDTLRVNIDLYVEAEYLPVSEVKEEIEEEREEVIIEPEVIEIQSIPEDEYIEDSTISDASVCKKEVDNREELDDLIITKDTFKEDDNSIEIKKIEPLVDNIEDMEIVPSLAEDLFSNLDNTETYTTYYVYIVKEDDTIDKILSKYNITKEELEDYNVLEDIKPGDKVIIPKTSE